jgi:hypothetical protein
MSYHRVTTRAAQYQKILCFVAIFLKVGLEDAIRWPSAQQLQQLSARLTEFPGRLGHVDGN